MKTQKVVKGGNCPICPAEKPVSPLLIWLNWDLRETLPSEIDVSLFLLAENGKVAGDADFIFYNQRTSESGHVRHLSTADAELKNGKAGFLIDIARIPADVHRLSISLTYYGDEPKAPLQTALTQSVIEIHDSYSGQTLAEYEFTDDVQEETALILGELYRHAGSWKFRAIGQGFIGGLSALAAHFGVCLTEPLPSEPSDNSIPEEYVGAGLQIRRKRRTPNEVLAEQTQQLKESLSRFLPQIYAACQAQENETRTRMILDRILQDALGYSMDNIKTEQNIQGRKADYVLAADGQDVLVVEVKRAGMSMRERQIFQATSYGAYSGIRWAVLTNLIEWQLYRISTGDKIEASQVFSVNLRNGIDTEGAYRLTLISAYGFSRKGLLDKLWLKLSTLSCERLAAALLNQEVISKMRAILSKESGVTLTQEEVQAAIEQNLLRLD